MLHTVNKSPTERNTLGSCLKHVNKGSVVLLIEDGVYGACNECEHKIPKTRLKAIPYTPYCVKCASQIESELR